MSYFCSSQMDVDTLHINLRLLISLKENPRHKTLCQNVIRVLKVLGKRNTWIWEGKVVVGGRDWRAENGDGFDPDIVMHGWVKVSNNKSWGICLYLAELFLKMGSWLIHFQFSISVLWSLLKYQIIKLFMSLRVF